MLLILLDDWDDELDGEYEPPLVDNPAFKGLFTQIIFMI